MKRRDLLDASKLLLRHKMDPSNPLLLGLAAEFLAGRKSGDITLSFQPWLDEEIDDDDEGDDLDEGEDFGEVVPEVDDDVDVEDPTKP
jgi:hypothetical protein